MMGVYKSLEDIKADFVLDLDEMRRDARKDAWAALRGSLGMTLVDAALTTIVWEWEYYDERP